jgi:hypothetical protein
VVNNKVLYLNSDLLYLDTEYSDIYTMEYITNNLLEDDSIIMENDAGAIVIKYIPYVVSISSIPRIKLKQPFYTIVTIK